MKYEEEIARQHLLSVGFVDTDLIYEPDGNGPPDFLVEGRIAVEVSRLNQHEITASGKVCGLEDLQFALHNSMENLFCSLGPPKNGRSWFVTYSFSRPLRVSRRLKSKVQQALAFARDSQSEIRSIRINDNFKLALTPSTELFPYHFVPGGQGDNDSAGFIRHELIKNIEICVLKKTAKIAKVRSKYPEWWLVLIDQIGYGTRETIEICHDWDKVILVNPLNPKSAYQI